MDIVRLLDRRILCDLVAEGDGTSGNVTAWINACRNEQHEYDAGVAAGVTWYRKLNGD